MDFEHIVIWFEYLQADNDGTEWQSLSKYKVRSADFQATNQKRFNILRALGEVEISSRRKNVLR
jgi:hypothetical protein